MNFWRSSINSLLTGVPSLYRNAQRLAQVAMTMAEVLLCSITRSVHISMQAETPVNKEITLYPAATKSTADTWAPPASFLYEKKYIKTKFWVVGMVGTSNIFF